MASRKRRIARGEPFDERRIAQRIDAARVVAGLEIKDFCEQVGWGKWDYTKKIVKLTTSISMHDFQQIAIVLKAGPGWPFVDTRWAEELRELQRRDGEKRRD